MKKYTFFIVVLAQSLVGQTIVQVEIQDQLEQDYLYIGFANIINIKDYVFFPGIQRPPNLGEGLDAISFSTVVNGLPPYNCIRKGLIPNESTDIHSVFEDEEGVIQALARSGSEVLLCTFDESFNLMTSKAMPALENARITFALSVEGKIYAHSSAYTSSEGFNSILGRILEEDTQMVELDNHRWWRSQMQRGSRTQLIPDGGRILLPSIQASEFEQWGLNNADVCLTFFDTSDFPQFEEKCFTTVQAVFPVEDEVNYLKLDTLDNHYYLTLTARDLIEVEGDIWSPTSRIYKFTKDFEYVQDWKIEDELAPLMEEAGIECIDNENLARRAYGNIYSSTTFDGRIIFRAQIDCWGGTYEYYATLGQDGFEFFPFELTEAYAFTQLLTLKDGRLLEAGWGSDFQRFTFFTSSEFDHFADSLRSTIITSSHSSVQLQPEFWHSNGRLYFEHLGVIEFDAPVHFFNLQGQLLGVDYLNPTDGGLNLPDYEGLMIVHHPAFQIKWMRW